jgi:hypothetical protein
MKPQYTEYIRKNPVLDFHIETWMYLISFRHHVVDCVIGTVCVGLVLMVTNANLLFNDSVEI